MKTLRLPLLILLLAFAVIAIFSSSVQRTIATQMINLEERMSGLKDAYTTIDGLTYHYLDNRNTKAEQTLVMIHGFGADTSNWARFARPFKSDYRIIVPDLIGFGESDKPMDVRYDFEAQARRVHALVTSLGIEQYHVVGNSMGGAISSVLGYLYPNNVQSMGLLNPAGIFKTHTEVTRTAFNSDKNTLIAETPEEFDKTMAVVMEKAPFLPWPITNVKAQDAVNSVAVKKYVFKELRNTRFADLTNVLADVKQPALVLWGERDRVLHPANANEFHALLPNSRLHIMKDIGHLPMVETPKATAQVYADFLNSF